MLRPAPPLWLKVSCCIALGAGLIRADAAGLTITPTSLTLAADQSSGEIWLSNYNDTPLRAQVRLYRWVQDQGQEKLNPTRDLVVSPQQLDIAPQQQQVIRLVRRGSTPNQGEAGYRIVIDEIPGPAASKRKQPLLRYSAPVFLSAAAAVPATPQLLASLASSDGQPALRVDNHGTAHARLADLSFISAQGEQHMLAAQLAGYILPGQYKRWPLPAHSGDYTQGHFQARINQNPVPQPLPLVRAP